MSYGIALVQKDTMQNNNSENDVQMWFLFLLENYIFVCYQHKHGWMDFQDIWMECLGWSDFKYKFCGIHEILLGIPKGPSEN